MNYPNDYIYKYVKKDELLNQDLYDKKVLFVFGDSWTNNRYVDEPKKHWCYLLKEKLNYDLVVNISDNYDSNYEIFDTIKKTLCDVEFPMKSYSYLNKLKGKLYGLLCEREKNRDWEKFLDNILIELYKFPEEYRKFIEVN